MKKLFMMKRLSLLSFIIMAVLSQWVNAQNQDARKSIVEKTNVKALVEFGEKSQKEYVANKKKALDLAKKNNWVVKSELPNGVFIELQGVSPDGRPIYYATDNKMAAQTVSTDKAWSNGDLGIELYGAGMILGEWDGGGVRLTHQEFNANGVARVTQQDYTSGTSYHATHVAGTMMAAGLDPNAKGMAPKATLYAHDWNNDNAEMTSFAASGYLLSNHSYGQPGGWEQDDSGNWNWTGNTAISTEEDYEFGFYGFNARSWDYIANNAPYYLIVQSAGNERGEGPSGGAYPVDGGADGYDCINNRKVAKNILTVGAVRDLPGGYDGNPSDVKMTSFSGWGPCDDGRIKPDICANGYELYSTFDGSDTDYSSISGTSMSTPSTTGSLMLLQEYYYRLYGKYMKAATLKALALHTADECGSAEGPDYMFGWGLLNTNKAAHVIANNKITDVVKEDVYNGTDYTYDIKALGNTPLVVTVVWSDPMGSPVTPALDPTDIMLVNDLDITVSNDDTTHYPYVLDGQNPSAPAIKGNNNVDNIEKVFIKNPEAGDYTIRITHEGSILGDSQDFSMIISGVTGFSQISNTTISEITQTTAKVAVTINNQSETPVIERGVIYAYDPLPDFNDNQIIDNSDDPTHFELLLENLSIDTTYNLRSYFINGEDTIISKNLKFRTEHPYPYLQSFENGLGKWEQAEDDDMQWTIHSGPTPTASTGPIAAPDGNYYLYTEATDNSNATAIIESKFNFMEIEQPVLYFYYHMYGSSMGDLFVDIKEGTQWHTNYFALEGQQQSSDSTDFYQASLDLKEFGGQDSIVIRFRAEVGSFFYSDIAIDKIEVGTDMYAPMLTQLNVVEVNNTWAQLKLKANDDGEACLLISNDTASTPTVDEILTGKKVTLTKNVEQLVTFEDLENNTCYKVSVITVDSVNNISEIYSIGFTTLLDGVQFDQSKNILIYPNPNQGLFYLNLSALNYRQASYTLFDALGRLVEQQKVNQQQTTIDINNRQKGLYYLQLLIDNQIYVKKIMAE